MSIEGLILSIIIIVIALIVALIPFLSASTPTDTVFLDKQRERALAYYERVLTNIRDLDDDHATAKINADEYAKERDIWMDRGVKLRKLIEELDVQHAIIDHKGASDAQIDALIAAQIEAMRPTHTEGTSA